MLTHDVPEYDETVECTNPVCVHEKKTEPLTGLYGMTGGGMGPYTVCSNCGQLLTKSEDPEACESNEVEIKDEQAGDDQADHAIEQDDRPDLDDK